MADPSSRCEPWLYDPTRPLIERLMTRVVAGHGGCVIWTGLLQNGYGLLKDKQKRRLAHRVAYAHFVGAIPEGLTLDHLCHTRDKSCPGGECIHRRCVNPHHLEPVTAVENVMRGRSFSGLNAAKTHCSRGHEFTPENTADLGRERSCRQCRKERQELAEQRFRDGRVPPKIKTHCSRGHELTPENTYTSPSTGGRTCRACIRATNREWRAARTAARNLIKGQ